MKRYFSIMLIVTSFFCFSCENLFNGDEDGLTTEEIVEGLKTALEIGTDTATSVLSLVNGYYGNSLYKIPLPPEADIIVDNLSLISVGEEPE